MPATLKELRELAGLTLRRAAKVTKVNATTICLIECGDIRGSGAIVAKIRRGLVRAIARRARKIQQVLLHETEHGEEAETTYLRSQKSEVQQ